MPANNFSIGKDVQFSVVTPQGILTLPVTVTDFEAKPITNKIRVPVISGKTIGANTPAGWEGQIGLERSNADVDRFFAQQEAGFFAGLNTLSGSITQIVQEANGSLTTFRYLDVCINLDEAGQFSGDKTVGQKIGFFASTRVIV